MFFDILAVCVSELASGQRLTPRCYISLCSADPANSVLFRILPKCILGPDPSSNSRFLSFVFRRCKTQADKEKQHGQCRTVEVLHGQGDYFTDLFSADVRDPLWQNVLSLQNGENQDSESIPRRSKSQLSQPGKRKGYPDSQSSDERPWLDSPVDADDITVQVPPPVAVSICN